MYRLVRKLSFVTGTCIGVLLAALLKSYNSPPTEGASTPPFQSHTYELWFRSQKLSRQQIPFDSIRYSPNKYTFESDFLYNIVTVYCLVLVKNPANAKAIQATWGPHCNHLQLLNLTTVKNNKMPILKRHKEESSWVRLCKALRQLPDKYKWVLIVHDVSFGVLENLRRLLAPLDYNQWYYLGHSVKFWNTEYNSGQAGFVLSKGAIEAVKFKFNSSSACSLTPTYNNREDYYLGSYLASMGVFPSDTRDSDGLSTFHQHNLNEIVLNKQDLDSVYPQKCCSPHLVTFRSIGWSRMYTYYYLLYMLQIFQGGGLGNRPFPKNFDDDYVWQHFLKSRGIPLNVTSKQYYEIWEKIVDPSLFMEQLKNEQVLD